MAGVHPPRQSSQAHAGPRPRSRPTSSLSDCRQHLPATWPQLCSPEGLRSPQSWAKLFGRNGTQSPGQPQVPPDPSATPPLPSSLAVQGALTWGGALTGPGQDECGQGPLQGQEQLHLCSETPATVAGAGPRIPSHPEDSELTFHLLLLFCESGWEGTFLAWREGSSGPQKPSVMGVELWDFPLILGGWGCHETETPHPNLHPHGDVLSSLRSHSLVHFSQGPDQRLEHGGRSGNICWMTEESCKPPTRMATGPATN